MARTKILDNPVTLFAAIEKEQHELLRRIAFEENKSIAEITREALDQYFEARGHERRTAMTAAVAGLEDSP